MSTDRAGVRLRRGVVHRVLARRRGALEVGVEVEGTTASAIAYTDLVGVVREGDEVLLNTTAVALGLGTGGLHLVVAVDGGVPDADPGARTMKARYTPLQVAVRGVEEAHRDAIEGSAGLSGTPVVCAPLHSMIAPIAALLKDHLKHHPCQRCNGSGFYQLRNSPHCKLNTPGHVSDGKRRNRAARITAVAC